MFSRFGSKSDFVAYTFKRPFNFNILKIVACNTGSKLGRKQKQNVLIKVHAFFLKGILAVQQY